MENLRNALVRTASADMFIMVTCSDHVCKGVR
jgi:hypothetical protein